MQKDFVMLADHNFVSNGMPLTKVTPETLIVWPANDPSFKYRALPGLNIRPCGNRLCRAYVTENGCRLICTDDTRILDIYGRSVQIKTGIHVLTYHGKSRIIGESQLRMFPCVRLMNWKPAIISDFIVVGEP